MACVSGSWCLVRRIWWGSGAFRFVSFALLPFFSPFPTTSLFPRLPFLLDRLPSPLQPPVSFWERNSRSRVVRRGEFCFLRIGIWPRYATAMLTHHHLLICSFFAICITAFPQSDAEPISEPACSFHQPYAAAECQGFKPYAHMCVFVGIFFFFLVVWSCLFKTDLWRSRPRRPPFPSFFYIFIYFTLWLCSRIFSLI